MCEFHHTAVCTANFAAVSVCEWTRVELLSARSLQPCDNILARVGATFAELSTQVLYYTLRVVSGPYNAARNGESGNLGCSSVCVQVAGVGDLTSRVEAMGLEECNSEGKGV